MTSLVKESTGQTILKKKNLILVSSGLSLDKAWVSILIGKRVGWYTRIVTPPLRITGKKLEIMKLLAHMPSKPCRVTKLSPTLNSSTKILVKNRTMFNNLKSCLVYQMLGTI